MKNVPIKCPFCGYPSKIFFTSGPLGSEHKVCDAPKCVAYMHVFPLELWVAICEMKENLDKR